MKNLLMALALGMVASTGINAWVTTIQNKSDGDMSVTSVYGAGCFPQSKPIKAGQTQSIDTGKAILGGICCTQTMNIIGTSGRGMNTNIPFNPPVTGSGLSCRDFTVVVTNAANGSLVAEQG